MRGRLGFGRAAPGLFLCAGKSAALGLGLGLDSGFDFTLPEPDGLANANLRALAYRSRVAANRTLG